MSRTAAGVAELLDLPSSHVDQAGTGAARPATLILSSPTVLGGDETVETVIGTAVERAVLPVVS